MTPKRSSRILVGTLVATALVGSGTSLRGHHNADPDALHGCLAPNGNARLLRPGQNCGARELPVSVPTGAAFIALQDRMTAAETKNREQDRDIEALKHRDQEHDEEIADLQRKDAEQDDGLASLETRVTAIEAHVASRFGLVDQRIDPVTHRTISTALTPVPNMQYDPVAVTENQAVFMSFKVDTANDVPGAVVVYRFSRRPTAAPVEDNVVVCDIAYIELHPTAVSI